MLKSQKSTGGNAVFYKSISVTAEVRAGYLYKSPPQKRLKTEKSWKRRYFVLYKISEQEHLMKYFRNSEEMDKPLGEIDLKNISLLYVSPEKHQKWNWVQKNQKCSPSCVLYIRAAERDYFLVGENSQEVDGWFADLFEALKSKPHKCLSSEEIYNGQSSIEVISKPLLRRKKSTAVLFEEELKLRSLSDPSSNNLDTDSEKQGEEHPKRRASEPVNPIYDYPRAYLTQSQNETFKARRKSTNSEYESMYEVRCKTQAADREVEEVTTGTLMRSVTEMFDKLRTQLSPLPSFNEETAAENREEKRLTSDFSSSSSDNGAISPVEMLDGQNGQTLEKHISTESLDTLTPGEIDLLVKQADLKKYLTLVEVDGKPSVSGWTGQPQTVCLFHKGDEILAVNDLHTGSVEMFNIYISKCLKNEVKVTILRLPGGQPLHSPSCPCSD